MSNLDKFADQRDSRLEQLFGDLPPETDMIVRLPSEGRFYSPKNPEVTITSIKFEDEKNLASSAKNNINPVNLILSKCVKGVEINSLLLIDKLFLLLKIREISYGAQYPAEVNCPHCQAKSEIKINLSELLVNYIPGEVDDPREIKLPKLSKIAKVRFPRVADEDYLSSSEGTYANLWRFVTELNGITDPVFISKAIPKMHIMDVKYIISQIMRSDLGLNPKFLFDCGFCSRESKVEVPINENFFSVT